MGSIQNDIAKTEMYESIAEFFRALAKLAAIATKALEEELKKKISSEGHK